MSLNQELKDFLVGFTATKKVFDDAEYKRAREKLMGLQGDVLSQKLKDMQDPEVRSADLNLKRERAGYLGAMSKRLREGPQRNQEVYDDTPSTPAIPDVTPAPAPAPGPQSALGIEEPEQLADKGGKIEDPKDMKDVDRVTDAARALGGDNATIGALERIAKGRAKGYAAGGPVTDDDDDEEDDSLPETAASTEGYGGYSPTAAHDAVQAGLQYNQQAAGLNQQTAMPDPQRRQRITAYLSGQGAPPPQLMDQIYAKIDPQKKLSESQRNMAALSAAYQYYIRKGDPRKAAAAAGSILNQNRINYMHYGALSKAAMEGGNLDGAAQFAAKAYANLPTGKEMRITNENGRLVYSVIDDATGKPIRKGILTPQELGSAITGFSPDKFDSTIMAMAGVRAQEEKAPRGEKPSDLKTRSEVVSGAMPQPAEGATPTPGAARAETDTKRIAYGLLQTNKLAPEDAIDIAKGLIDRNANLQKAGDAKDGAYYKFKGGPKFYLSNDDIERVVEMRAMSPVAEKGDEYGPTKPLTAKVTEAGSKLGERVGEAMKSGTKITRRDNTQRVAKQSADQFEANEAPATAAALADNDEE